MISFLSHICRSVSDFPIELFGVQRSIDALAVLVEHTVGADFLGRLRLCSGVEIHTEDARQQKVDQTELQLNRYRPACGPEQEIDQVQEVGEHAAGFGCWEFSGCLRC